MVDFLLEKNAKTWAISKNEDIALLLASYYGHSKVAELLLRKNSDVNQTDKNGNTALTLASGNNHPETVKMLANIFGLSE